MNEVLIVGGFVKWLVGVFHKTLPQKANKLSCICKREPRSTENGGMIRKKKLLMKGRRSLVAHFLSARNKQTGVILMLFCDCRQSQE